MNSNGETSPKPRRFIPGFIRVGLLGALIAICLQACGDSAPDAPASPTASAALASASTPTPASAPAPTAVPTSASAPTATLVLTNTPAPTPTSVPTSAPEAAPTATFVPANTLESTPTAALAPTSTPETPPTATPVPTNTPAPVATSVPTNTPAPTATSAPTATPVPANTPAPVATLVPTPVPAVNAGDESKHGFSSNPGSLSPYIKPAEIDGTGRKLLAIYMVGSDLEENQWAGTIDFYELIEGYDSLTDKNEVEVIVAFGGADKDGWRGMKFADMLQIEYDEEDGEFGNETHPGAYLYQADYANMDDESSLKLFLDYLRDGYPNYDQRFLTFWDHGNSYKGFGGDSNFKFNDYGDKLYLDEIARAFERSQAGTFDLIGFDACLMASVEVAKIIAPNARYMIASEDLEPGHGWLWSEVIRSYAHEDSIVEAGKRMVDNFVQNVHVAPGKPEAKGKTLSLLDLSQYDQLVSALNPVISAYDRQMFASREYSDSLIWGVTGARSYGESDKAAPQTSIDLKHFAQLLLEATPNAEVSASLNRLIGAVDDFVVHSNHDGSVPNSFGIAIDAPENSGKEYEEYSAYKVNETWLDFQDTFRDYLESDIEPPELTNSYVGADGELFATFNDENIAGVTTVYGFVESVESEDYFMVVAELEAYPTEYEGEYFTPVWDQWWFTVEHDSEEPTAWTWIPASFDERFVAEDGREYTTYVSEMDYYLADASVPDTAVMTLFVDENMEVVDHQIQTYWEDEEGAVWFDKATFRIEPGDAVQFWNWGFHLDDPSADGWFAASDKVTFVQDPVFQLELLEFTDEFGQPVEYYYALWAEDASGNGELFY